MERPQLVVVATVLAGVAIAALVVATGAGPALGGETTTTTATPAAADTTAPATTAATTTTSGPGPGWSFGVDSIESCGRTCRDVTATLANNGSVTREGVTVTTRIYADGEQLWSGTNDVGTLDPGEANTATRRVDVGYGGALAIEGNDGYITVETVVRWDGGTTTFRERKQVA